MAITTCSSLSRLFVLVFCVQMCHGHLLEGLYCGKENCYDVLNVTRDMSVSDIKKAYRRLARIHHPDKHRDEVAKQEAEIKFKEITTAYEILREDDARNDYNYMLDNPSEYYAHYYRYYRRRMTPKVDVRLVVIVTITIVSIIQYYSLWQRYDSAIKYFMTVPKYRYKAMEIAEQQKNSEAGKSAMNGGGKTKGRNRMSKAEQREELERTIRKIIEDKMDIKGAYAKPKISDVLWVQLVILPYTIAKYVKWYAGWIWKFTILKRPYGIDEKLYLIRKFMGMGQHQFDGIEDDEKEHYLELELWEKENFLEWKEEKEEEMKKNLAESARHKQYRRYMKNHGPSRMTFED